MKLKIICATIGIFLAMTASSMPGDSLRLNTSNYYLSLGLGIAKNAVQYKIQLAGCRSNAKDYKAKLDSVVILDETHKKFEGKQMEKIAKLENKLRFFKGVGLGLSIAIIFREGLTLLREKL